MSTPLTLPVGPRDHIQGPLDAPLTLVEYGDFECPYCAAAHPIVTAVQRQMGDRLRFVFRHFPLMMVHPHAENAAEISEAAAREGKFWEMHDMLFEHRDALEDERLVAYAAALGIDPQWAATALVRHTFAPRVREDFVSGVRSGVNGTPTFFINGVRHDGSWDEVSLVEALGGALYAASHR